MANARATITSTMDEDWNDTHGRKRLFQGRREWEATYIRILVHIDIPFFWCVQGRRDAKNPVPRSLVLHPLPHLRSWDYRRRWPSCGIRALGCGGGEDAGAGGEDTRENTRDRLQPEYARCCCWWQGKKNRRYVVTECHGLCAEDRSRAVCMNEKVCDDRCVMIFHLVQKV